MENLYETDYYRWVQQQKEFLVNRQFDRLDVDHLIEEVDDMGSELDTLESRLTTLILHLLKYQYQTRVLNPVMPEPYNCREWVGTVNRTRLAINKLLRRRPHLKAKQGELLAESYQDGKTLAVKAMNYYVQPHQKLDHSSFPDACPWTIEQIMDDDWLPE